MAADDIQQWLWDSVGNSLCWRVCLCLSNSLSAAPWGAEGRHYHPDVLEVLVGRRKSLSAAPGVHTRQKAPTKPKRQALGQSMKCHTIIHHHLFTGHLQNHFCIDDHAIVNYLCLWHRHPAFASTGFPLLAPFAANLPTSSAARSTPDSSTPSKSAPASISVATSTARSASGSGFAASSLAVIPVFRGVCCSAGLATFCLSKAFAASAASTATRYVDLEATLYRAVAFVG